MIMTYTRHIIHTQPLKQMKKKKLLTLKWNPWKASGVQEQEKVGTSEPQRTARWVTSENFGVKEMRINGGENGGKMAGKNPENCNYYSKSTFLGGLRLFRMSVKWVFYYWKTNKN